MKTLLTPLALALLATSALAQTPGEDQRLKELERKVDILSRQLEQQQMNGTQPPAKEEGQFGLGAAASKVYSAQGGVSIGGYGEFLYTSVKATDESGARNYQTPTLDSLRAVFYIGYKFSDRIVFNSEVEFEHGGYGDERNQGEAHAEFAYLDFLLAKSFNLRAGHLLIPMGFINEIHEPPTFLGANRPYTEGDEGGLIPTTWHENGFGIHGELPANLSYRLYVVDGLTAQPIGANVAGFSGEGIGGGRQDGSATNAQSLAWTGRLDWTPVPGALLGGSFFSGNSNQTGGGPRIQTTVMDFHAEYRAHGLQARGLFVRTTNSDGGVAALPATSDAFQVGTRQFGGYLEVGYDVLAATGSRKALIPFARWERLSTQERVVTGAIADLANDRTVKTLGLVFKPVHQIALKANFDRITNGARTGQDRFNVALGYYF